MKNIFKRLGIILFVMMIAIGSAACATKADTKAEPPATSEGSMTGEEEGSMN